MTAQPEFYVNLPLRYIYNKPEYLDIFIARGVHPELGLDCLDGECLSSSWLKEIKSRIDDAGLSCTAHLPFLDLKPGSLSRAIRHATVEIITSAMDVAAMFSPARMVMHPSLTSWLEPDLFERTVEYCCESIAAISDHWPDHPVLCLENTHEPTPETLAGIVKSLNRDNIGICFDLGHWFSFEKGSRNNDFDNWFEVFSPYIRHLHLHDNNGDSDSHMTLGKGNIDWNYIVPKLAELSPRPTITLEPHNREDFEGSIEYLKKFILPKIR